MALSDLLRPTAVADFLDTAWGREPDVFRGAAADLDLLDLDGVEAMLGGLHHAHEGVLHLAEAGDRRALPASMVDADGMLDLHRVRKAFAGGETLYLTKAHRLRPALSDLCRAVELELADHGVALREPAGAHVFLTPPRAQGFPPHRDEHASVVVQLDGGKTWAVEDGPGPPRPGGIPAGVWAGTSLREITLDAGDVLYLPPHRGHAARTGDRLSLHLTVRLFPLRWRDLLDDVAAGLPGLDAPVPRAAAAPSAAADGLAALLASPQVRAALPALLDGATARRTSRRAPLADGGLAGVGTADVDEKTWLVRTRGTGCHVVGDGATATIHFPGGAVRGPAAARTAFERVARDQVVRAADLTGPLGADAALDVVRRLMVEGVLRRARPGELDGIDP